MYKTWICNIFGGGTPTYLVSALNEKEAWQLIRKEFNLEYGEHLSKDGCTGLIEVPWWYAEGPRISDVHKMYTHKGTMLKGSYKDFNG